MTGNDQTVWKYQFGVRTVIICDLGCPRRYSGVLEGNFRVDSQNPKKRAGEYHFGVRTVRICDLGCPGRFSGVLEGDFHVCYQNPKVGCGCVF